LSSARRTRPGPPSSRSSRSITRKHRSSTSPRGARC
jgi:hypothetical protein